jgi:EmrB/QacA subfamily drug resistance transporter
MKSVGVNNANKWQILIALALGTAMVPINASIINVSLPTITEFFQTSVAISQWVLTAYLLMLLSLVLFFGRFGDFYGQEKLYIYGLSGFLLSSILCSFSTSIEQLIIFRGFQGITAAMMISVSMGIVRRVFPVEELGRALGIYSMAIAAGLALGPVIGGFLEGMGSWRNIFLVNIPLGMISLILCYFILERKKGNIVKWDLKGIFLQFMVLFALVLGLNIVQSDGINLNTFFIGLFILILFLLFIRNEKNASNPLLNLSLFKNLKFSAYNLALLFNYISMYMVLFIMPFYLQKILHTSLDVIGLLLTVSPVIMMILAPCSGYLSDKFGSRYLACIGSIIFSLSLYSMSQLTQFSDVSDVFWRFAVMGIGAAFFQAPNNRSIMANISAGQSGMASSIIVTMRNLGMILAVSFAGILLYTTISPNILQTPQLFNLAAYDFTTGMHRIMIVGAILSAINAFLSLIKIHNNKSRFLKK